MTATRGRGARAGVAGSGVGVGVGIDTAARTLALGPARVSGPAAAPSRHTPPPIPHPNARSHTSTAPRGGRQAGAGQRALHGAGGGGRRQVCRGAAPARAHALARRPPPAAAAMLLTSTSAIAVRPGVAATVRGRAEGGGPARRRAAPPPAAAAAAPPHARTRKAHCGRKRPRGPQCGPHARAWRCAGKPPTAPPPSPPSPARARDRRPHAARRREPGRGEREVVGREAGAGRAARRRAAGRRPPRPRAASHHPPPLSPFSSGSSALAARRPPSTASSPSTRATGARAARSSGSASTTRCAKRRRSTRRPSRSGSPSAPSRVRRWPTCSSGPWCSTSEEEKREARGRRAKGCVRACAPVRPRAVAFLGGVLWSGWGVWRHSLALPASPAPRARPPHTFAAWPPRSRSGPSSPRPCSTAARQLSCGRTSCRPRLWVRRWAARRRRGHGANAWAPPTTSLPLPQAPESTCWPRTARPACPRWANPFPRARTGARLSWGGSRSLRPAPTRRLTPWPPTRDCTACRQGRRTGGLKAGSGTGGWSGRLGASSRRRRRPRACACTGRCTGWRGIQRGAREEDEREGDRKKGARRRPSSAFSSPLPPPLFFVVFGLLWLHVGA